jgi:succinate-semialdehyde dehydrogenase/glutarate-semialdehyde dehydrogenase
MTQLDTQSGTETTRYFARTVNPATGEPLTAHPGLSDAAAEGAIARAHDAFGTWRQVPITERVHIFRRIADLVEARSDGISRLCSQEMGKPVAQSVLELSLVAAMYRYYADHGPALLADEEITVPGFRRTVVRRTPMGVVLGIEPWNAPLYQAMRAAAPNLMLGNTVLLKPSEITPGCTLLLDEILAEAGVPDGVYTTVLLSHEQAATAIADQRVRAVTLTGSDRAGEIVGASAGRHLKPAVLELGGSDAFIVLESADVAAAATTGVACRLAFGGQVCSSPKRVILAESVAEEFTAAYVQGFTSQVVGDPFDPATTLGPLASAAAADRLHEQYADAVDKGATVLVAGGRVAGPGAFFAPAVLTDITPDMRLYSEEAFGPIGVIYRVPDADAAVELANSSRYGLGGTVFGAEDEARAVAERLDTGMVGINAWLGAPVEVPFGGTKASGFGRELGRSGMDQFANVKTYATA